MKRVLKLFSLRDFINSEQYMSKLKKNKRKAKHVYILRERITELHDSIFHRALNGDTPKIIEAKLLKKYNRRLKLILYQQCDTSQYNIIVRG